MVRFETEAPVFSMEDRDANQQGTTTTTHAMDTRDVFPEEEYNAFSLLELAGGGILVGYDLLHAMPPDLHVLSSKFWSFFHSIEPADPEYPLPLVGGLRNPRNFNDYRMTGFYVAKNGQGWVLIREEGDIEWHKVEEVKQKDPVQLYFEILKRGLIFVDSYWWFVVDAGEHIQVVYDEIDLTMEDDDILVSSGVVGV